MKKLNLSTAFLLVYNKLTDESKTTTTDLAVAAFVLYNWNNKAWQSDFVSTISSISFETGAQPKHIRESLVKLGNLQLLKLQSASEQIFNGENEQVKVTNRTKLRFTKGAAFDDYAVFKAIQYNTSINTNVMQQSPPVKK